MSLAAACGGFSLDKSVNDQDSGMAKHLGCVEGYVMNGVTGGRVDFAALNLNDAGGISIDVAGARLGAALQLAPSNLGGYRICDVPLDEAYVLRAEIPGFEIVEGLIRIRSTVEPFADEAETDIAKQVPSLNVNVAVYPKGVATQDLKFMISSFGAPAPGATVNLKPSTGGAAAIVDSAGFLVPTTVGASNLSAVTDDEGVALFPAAELMLGARYEYVVLPPAGDIYLEPVSGLFELSVRDVNASVTSSSPYLQFVNFQGSAPQLAELQFSSQSNSYDESGSLIIVFNRQIEILPGTEDEIRATLAKANGAELESDVRGNFKPDQVTYKVDGYRLILTPKWKVEPQKQREGGLTVAYAGIRVRPAAAPRTADVLNVGEQDPAKLIVPVFGAITPEQIAAALQKPSDHGDGQSGPAGGLLNQPLKIQVLDQFGMPYRRSALNVTFQVMTGAGGLATTNTGTFANMVTVTTDAATGVAFAYFKLGTSFGAQNVEARISGLPTPVQFSANAVAAATAVAVVSGGNATGPADSELSAPIVVQINDQFGNPLGAGADVTFIPSAGGMVRGAGNAQTQVTVDTDAQGRASVYWKLGSSVGQQTLAVRAGTAAVANVTATATARLGSIFKAAGDGASVDLDGDVTLALQLRDHTGANYPAAGLMVRFEVSRGTGNLRARATDTVGSATALEVATDSSGRATVVLRITGGDPNAIFNVVARQAQLTAVFAGTVRATLRSVAIIGGEGQSAAVNTDLATPFTVQLQDQSGGNLAAQGVAVTFAVTGGTGLVRAVDSSGSGTNTVTVYSDFNGRAKAQFKVTGGAAGSSFRVEAATNNLPTVVFNGTVAP